MATTTRTAPSTTPASNRSGEHPGEDRRPPARPNAAAQPVQIGERRRSSRRTIVKPCKVFHRRLARFIGGETSNASGSGLLLRVDHSRPVMVGDEVQVAVAWDRRAPVLRSQALRSGRIVRVTPIDHHHQAIAVAMEDVHTCAGGEALPVAGRIQSSLADPLDEVIDHCIRAA